MNIIYQFQWVCAHHFKALVCEMKCKNEGVMEHSYQLELSLFILHFQVSEDDRNFYKNV